MKPLVLALPGAEALAETMAQQLHCAASTVEAHHFPDGEVVVRLRTSVTGLRVLLVAHLERPDDKTMALVFAADAARELGAQQVGLVAPYLPYMRQDERFRPGEAITSRSYARLLSSTVDFLVTVDPHLHRWRSLEEIYRIPARVVPAAPAIARWLQREVSRPILVGPDGESEQWVADVAGRIGAPWVVMTKERRGDWEVHAGSTLIGNARRIWSSTRRPSARGCAASRTWRLLRSAARARAWGPRAATAGHGAGAPGANAAGAPGGRCVAGSRAAG
jgi:ribose-phosphate pyrophosphokinase